MANSLDPDQAGQNVGTGLGPNCLTLVVFLKILSFKKSIKNPQNEKACKITQYKDIRYQRYSKSYVH